MDTITDRQQEVLQYHTNYYLTEGVPPTMRQIAKAFGWSSANAAQSHCDALERKGMLRKTNRGFVPV